MWLSFIRGVATLMLLFGLATLGVAAAGWVQDNLRIAFWALGVVLCVFGAILLVFAKRT